MDDREDQNYVENEEAIKPTGVHLRKLEQGYMTEVIKNHLAQQSLWLINNLHFCYSGALPAKNKNEKKHFLQHNEKHKYQRSLQG